MGRSSDSRLEAFSTFPRRSPAFRTAAINQHNDGWLAVAFMAVVSLRETKHHAERDDYFGEDRTEYGGGSVTEFHRLPYSPRR